jgi:hypothetical protein
MEISCRRTLSTLGNFATRIPKSNPDAPVRRSGAVK